MKKLSIHIHTHITQLTFNHHHHLTTQLLFWWLMNIKSVFIHHKHKHITWGDIVYSNDDSSVSLRLWFQQSGRGLKTDVSSLIWYDISRRHRPSGCSCKCDRQILTGRDLVTTSPPLCLLFLSLIKLIHSLALYHQSQYCMIRILTSHTSNTYDIYPSVGHKTSGILHVLLDFVHVL